MPLSITVVLLALGLTLGCGEETQKWLGTWSGDLKRTPPDAPNDYVTTTINLIELRLNGDGTFLMLESGIRKSGTVRYGSEKAILKIARIEDRPIEQLGTGAEQMNRNLTATWQPDGSITLSDPGGFDAEPVRLTRSEQP